MLQVKQVQGQVQDVMNVMHSNIDKVLDRGENLVELQVTSHNNYRARGYWKAIYILYNLFSFILD